MSVETETTRLMAKKNWLQSQVAKWQRDVAYVLYQARTLTFVLKHSQTPWHARLVAGCALGYLLSPIQLIPTFIPVIGQMDDLLVLFVGMKLLRKLTSDSVVAECEAQARSTVFIQRNACKATSGAATNLGTGSLETSTRPNF